VSPPNFRTLDLNLLRVFDEVMAEGSLTRAARNLSLTQPAVSNALRRLRETLGDELVQRSGQGMAPTPRARAIWPAVREALAQLQSSLIPNEFVPAEANTSFVLAMSDASAAELIPVLTETLEKQAPRVTHRQVASLFVEHAARGAPDHPRPAQHARRRGLRPGGGLLSVHAGRLDGAHPKRRAPAIFSPAAFHR